MGIQVVKEYFLAILIFMFALDAMATASSDYDLGLESYKAGDNAAAVNYFESAMKKGMDSISLQYNLASSYYRLGKYEQAKTYFKQLNKTSEMKDLAEYHLGLIAIKEKDGSLARRYFNSIVNSGKDTRLIKLSKKQLDALYEKENLLKAAFSFNLGYDDNISSVSDDSVLDRADSFYEYFASTDLLITGRRKNGWVANASLFGIKYSDIDVNNENHFIMGLKRAMKFEDWDTSIQLNLSKSTYGDDDFQSITKLDLIGQKRLPGSQSIYLRYQLEDIKSEQPIYNYLEGWRQRGKLEYRSYSKANIKQIYYELELNSRGELVTLTDAYDYSPTRHTVRGKYTHIYNKQWWLTGDLSYRLSDYPGSSTVDRDDKQWKLALSADYRIDRTFKVMAKYQYTDNASTVDRYAYDKSVIKVGLSKLF